MTPETRNVEWKRSWRDEYLAWICGFANAQAGIPEIGRDDDGRLRLRDGVEGDQAEPTSTQIRVNDENIEIGNSARLPPDRVAEDTGMPSRPHNSRIARAFFRTGMIEVRGRGIRQITERCREAGNPTPTWTREPGIDSGNDCRARIRRVGSDRAGRCEVGHEGEYG